MRIRTGTKSDVDQVIALFKILDKKHINNQSDFKMSIDLKRYTNLINKCFNEEGYCLSIAEKDSNLIGFGIGRLLTIKNHPFLINRKIGEILYLIVDDKYQLKGFGGDILVDLEAKLKSKGVESFELRVYDFNKEAYPEKCNYKKKFTSYEKLAE